MNCFGFLMWATYYQVNVKRSADNRKRSRQNLNETSTYRKQSDWEYREKSYKILNCDTSVRFSLYRAIHTKVASTSRDLFGRYTRRCFQRKYLNRQFFSGLGTIVGSQGPKIHGTFWVLHNKLWGYIWGCTALFLPL